MWKIICYSMHIFHAHIKLNQDFATMSFNFFVLTRPLDVKKVKSQFEDIGPQKKMVIWGQNLYIRDVQFTMACM